MNVETGRFISQDSYEGVRSEPITLHKYLYANADGVNGTDPSGNYPLSEVTTTSAAYNQFQAQYSQMQLAAASRFPLALFTAGGSLTVVAGGSTITISTVTLGSSLVAFSLALGTGLALNELITKINAGDTDGDGDNDEDDGFVFFAHGTSSFFADDINTNGVNEASIRSSQAHSTRVSGSFYVLPLLPPDAEAGIDGAKAFGRRQPARPSAVLIGGLPKKVFKQLEN